MVWVILSGFSGYHLSTNLVGSERKKSEKPDDCIGFYAASAARVLRLGSRLKDLNLGWEFDMTISKLGIDIARNTFQLHGAGGTGKATQACRLCGNFASVHYCNGILWGEPRQSSNGINQRDQGVVPGVWGNSCANLQP
jgi:hypothetical protein